MKKCKDFYCHPTSIIDDGAEVKKGTKIWHFSHILKGAKIGKDCIIGQNVMVGLDVRIGNNVKIQNNVSIYKGITLEDDVFCSPSCVFTNVYNPRSFIRRMDKLLPTVVKRGATIGANATIVCGNIIGKYAFIGAGAVVTADVPDYALSYGNPARIKGWICQCGFKLNFKNKIAVCNECSYKYKKLKNKIKSF